MSDGSDGTKPLGRVQLQRRPQVAEFGGAASVALDDVPRELMGAVFEASGKPAVDLRRVVISLSVLAHVPRELARDRLILPLCEDPERLTVAVADPGERRALEELSARVGRPVTGYLAMHGQLRDVIEDAYAAQAAGGSQYRGTLASMGERETAPPPPNAEGALDTSLADASASLKVTRFDEDLSRPLLAELAGLPSLDGGSLPPEAAPSRKKKLLVVDDSDDIRRLLVRALRENDYDVVESASGLDALEKVREHAPDALILDAMLPEVHGFDICRRIKSSRRYGHLPVVMLSAVYRGWRVAEDLHRSYGVDAFLEKPFRIGDVLAAVERVLAGRGRSQPPEDGEADAQGAAGEHLRAGIDAYTRGDIESAVAQLKQGVVIDPLAFRLHYHLGLLYGKQEKVFEAIQALEAAADLRPRDFPTLKNLAVLYQRVGFRLKASEMWERALGSAPDDDTRISIRNHLVSLL